MQLTADLTKKLLAAQQDEITAHEIYKHIAATLPADGTGKGYKTAENRAVLEHIALDELGHYNTIQKYTGAQFKPQMGKARFFTFLSRVFGFTFAVKQMEKSESLAQSDYEEIMQALPEMRSVLQDEEDHEEKLLGMLDEESLHYAGSVVLGLNDALVELTGALAGFTLALRNVQLIALSGLITGVAASLSMASSEYLSTRDEKTDKKPLRAALVTGAAYVATVALLILPFLLLKNEFVCLAISVATAVIIIALFNYYISVAKGENFRRRFLVMAGLSLGIALISFIISFFLSRWLGVSA